MSDNKVPDRDSSDKPDYLKWASFGLEFGGVITIFCYIGFQIDAALNSSPWFLLAGFFLSFIGMLYILYKQTKNK